MAGIAEGVAAEISASIIKKAATQAQYVFSFNNFVETLEKEKEELILKQGSIEGDAVRAHRRAETIDAEVQKWLDVAENLMEEVDQLEQEIHMHKAAWCCPNFIQRYRLGRRVAKKTQQLTQLKGNCNFRVFARLATLQGMKYYSSEGFISFESRKRVHDQLMEALKDDGIHRIGVHGMGGCGKTTMVKEVGKEAEELGLFEKVLIVVVSNNPDIKKIQGSIASSLDFKFDMEENEPERARRLSMALSSMRRILVILDDVWEKLNFEDIGIPNNCYILLTTRELSVCNTMECQEKVSLLLLNEEEPWNLFQNCAGITEENFDTFKALGQEIANECKGLPVAIAAVAGSLKGKELVDWKYTRDKLRVSEPVDIEPGLPNPYKCLQVSYDNLVKAEFKLLFLLCSVFPEDEEIPEEWLARFAMGLGLFGKIHSNERTRNQVSVAINKLVGSCLLLNGDERNTIKMHDLVHDIALQIAKTENKIIMGKKISKKELEENSILIDHQVRYLFLDMDEFPEQLNYPNLECLLIHTNSEYQVREPYNYFNGMKELKVLCLHGNHKCPIVLLSNSFESLTNLRYFWLDEWELSDMSFVGSLTTIEALTLNDCSFHELPDSIINLKNLRLMDLVDCKIESNPYGVLQRCAQLEELCFIDNEYPEWEEKGENRVEFPVDALIRRAEVLSLGGIHRGCASIIPAFVQKIGEGMNELAKFIVHNSDELECVVDMTNSFYQDGAVFSNLTHLKISELEKLESLFLGQPHHHIFQKLEELHISECNQLKHLIANEPREIVSDGLLRLEELEIKGCSQLKYLFTLDDLEFRQQDQTIPKNGIFCNLTKLVFDGLDCLETLFVGTLHLGGLEKLEEISIRRCNHLKHLIANDVEKITSYGENSLSYNLVFSKLKEITIVDCHEIEYLMPISFATGLLQLENVEIYDAYQLKYVFGPSNHKAEDQFCNQNLNELHILRLQALKSLSLQNLPNIMNICPETYYPIWPSLDSLLLVKCPRLNIKPIKNCIIDLELRQQHHTITKELGAAMLSNVQNLKSLSVYFDDEVDGIFHLQGFLMDGQQLPKLREVYRGVELQTLRHRVVYHCPKLSLKSSATLANLKETYGEYFRKVHNHECVAIGRIWDIVQAASEMMKEESESGNIEEKEQESDQENPTSKETVIAPLSVPLEQSNKGRVEESPTFDDVTLTHAKSTSSPRTAGQPQEKEDHNEELGNDSKNKHHQKTSLAELSATMPEAQSGTVQSEEKSCNWGKFEESPLEKTTSHQIVPEKLDIEIGQIIEETTYKIVQKSPVLAKSEEKASSIELVQNVPMNEPLSVAKYQALETKKVSSSSQLSFSAGVPLPITVPSPTSLHFNNTSNAEVTSGDHILGDFDHNKHPKEFFEAIEQSSISGPLVLLQNPSPQSDRGRIEQVPTTDTNLVTSTKANATGSLLDLPQGQNRISQTKTNNREDPKVEPVINLQAFEGTDLVDLFQSMEEDDDVQASMPSTSVISANNSDMEVKSIAKALADLQISLKMPLENIACSEVESLRLENALNFLSSHSCADGAMSDGLKAAIDSLHQEFHNILSSFKQASATILRFTLLEEKEKTIKEELPRRKELAIALMNEIQQKEVSVMEQISKLQDELSSLQEQKKKCIADAIRFKSEFESVKNNKAQMLEDHVNSREELFKVDYIWSTLCSEFVDNLFSASNLP
ncbi:hypothetical protein L6164_031702 [Bauhinia variegata]|uniref:Uncharacterized protein n=1 Tax=Bauhinia variegata TaxID=167791 RepID=A0ACB9LHF1_BAUVA|nr:hypothetical protein L6164_031702 [Bauhinia variegata]